MLGTGENFVMPVQTMTNGRCTDVVQPIADERTRWYERHMEWTSPHPSGLWAPVHDTRPPRDRVSVRRDLDATLGT